MVKVIMGLKGTGKTKKLIDLVVKAANEENGDVVCIERDGGLTYDIPYQVRLIQASDYKFESYDFLKGFMCGLHASNYDVSHIFIDGLLKIVPAPVDTSLEDFLDWCENFSEKQHVKFTITINADAELATPGVKKYF